jgi:outer membrane protein assembly factor BamB
VIPSAGYAAGGSLYLTQTSPLGEHTGEIYEVSRINPQTGQMLAARRFDDQLDCLLLAGGSLWATTSASDTTLWRLDPRSLAVRSHVRVPTSRFAEGIVGSLAAAGGKLWVGTGELARVSLTSGRVEHVVTLPFRGPVQVAADSTGRILVASLGFEHPVHIARLNPQTGAVVSQQTIPLSVSQPTLGGIVDGRVWIDNTAGAKTIMARLSIDPLTAARTTPLATPANRVIVRVLDGVVWVTEPLRDTNLNYCADPITGRPLVELPPLPGDSVLLAADASTIYYIDLPLNAHSVRLESAPISRRCQA